MIDLIKDLIKIFVSSIVEFWMDITITKGTREYIENEKRPTAKGKRIFQRICFLITLFFIGYFCILGIYDFIHKEFVEGTIAALLAAGISFGLIVVKIHAKY